MGAAKDEDGFLAARQRELAAWLGKHGARCLWEQSLPAPAHLTVECWALGHGLVVVVLHEGGWDLYTSANTNKTKETFEDAERRLGLRK